MPITLRPLTMAFEQQTLQGPVLLPFDGQAIHIVMASRGQQLACFFRLLLVDPTSELTNTAALTESPGMAQHHHLLGQWMSALGILLQSAGLQAFATDGFQPLACLRAVPASLRVATQIPQYRTGFYRSQLVLVPQQHEARM